MITLRRSDECIIKLINKSNISMEFACLCFSSPVVRYVGRLMQIACLCTLQPRERSWIASLTEKIKMSQYLITWLLYKLWCITRMYHIMINLHYADNCVVTVLDQVNLTYFGKLCSIYVICFELGSYPIFNSIWL